MVAQRNEIPRLPRDDSRGKVIRSSKSTGMIVIVPRSKSPACSTRQRNDGSWDKLVDLLRFDAKTSIGGDVGSTSTQDHREIKLDDTLGGFDEYRMLRATAGNEHLAAMRHRHAASN